MPILVYRVGVSYLISHEYKREEGTNRRTIDHIICDRCTHLILYIKGKEDSWGSHEQREIAAYSMQLLS